MSASPNQQPLLQQQTSLVQLQSSPPSSVTANENVPNKVIVPLPVIQQQDEIYYYVFVKGMYQRIF